jgi:dTDP-4-amino-4,6-dideoxygalactose transaminase
MGVFPRSRFRIYSSFSGYINILKDIVFRRAEKGDDCKRLEEDVCNRINIKYAICAPQARVAIYFAVKAFIKHGRDKIVLSPYTIADVINMVICAGGKPVFADIERETCNINPSQIESLIDNNTAAVLVTHIQGLVCDMQRIQGICKKHGVPLIEDCAQVFGAMLNNKRAGTFGDAAIYSFGMYKNLLSFYGGMLVTKHEDIHNSVKAEMNRYPYTEMNVLKKRVFNGLLIDIVTHPILFKDIVFWIFRFGYLHDIGVINRFVQSELDLSRKNEMPERYFRRMTPMQARLVLSRIDSVAHNSAIRIKYAKMYHKGLSGLPGIILPPLRTDGSHIYSYYPIQYGDRNKLLHWMALKCRDIGAQHLKNCADLPAFEDFYRDCPNTRATAEDVILLPTYPEYLESNVKRNIKVIREFFNKIPVKESA